MNEVVAFRPLPELSNRSVTITHWNQERDPGVHLAVHGERIFRVQRQMCGQQLPVPQTVNRAEFQRAPGDRNHF